MTPSRNRRDGISWVLWICIRSASSPGSRGAYLGRVYELSEIALDINRRYSPDRYSQKQEWNSLLLAVSAPRQPMWIRAYLYCISQILFCKYSILFPRTSISSRLCKKEKNIYYLLLRTYAYASKREGRYGLRNSSEFCVKGR